MPELPEVELTVRYLKFAGLIGHRLEDILFYDSARTLSGHADHTDHADHARAPNHRLYTLLANSALQDILRKEIIGHSVQEITRRGKYIIMRLSNGHYVIAHLGMSGKIVLASAHASHGNEPAHDAYPHERIRIILNRNKYLQYIDPRMFGSLYCHPNRAPLEQKLGVEPLADAFTADFLFQALPATRRHIKSALLAQNIVAGLGNIYTDEALWQARIHPQRPACSLTRRECIALHAAIRTVLMNAIEHGGTDLGDGPSRFHVPYKESLNQNYIHVYNRADRPCENCGEPIVKKSISGRSAHYCPHCQRLTRRQ